MIRAFHTLVAASIQQRTFLGDRLVMEYGGSRSSNLDATIREHLCPLDHLHTPVAGLSPGGATKSTPTIHLVARQVFQTLPPHH